MDLRPALQIKTVIKAMLDVVLPAVDPHNKLAQEQARLVVGMLQLLARHLPLIYRYDRDELSGLLALANALQEQARNLPGIDGARHALVTSAEAGSDVLERARAEPGELEAANFDLRERVGALITAMYSANDFSSLKHVSETIAMHSREQLLRERAWLVSQGWEANPQTLPAIEELISRAPGGW
ncbi:MAG: hypothetical protein CVU18_02810 [Betaproteobacteria bacterium HGW-Betaproteobacteria-12]|nr:MAG: hypothetical protein CVU18_02810 [Betaproteobacteria bacterium HGW-Betaproteobacteria-12]